MRGAIKLIPDGAVVGVDLHAGDGAEVPVLSVLEQVNIGLTQQVEPCPGLFIPGGGGGVKEGSFCITT
jgi:hypothetical protein